jgi:RND family efflux transporter MFP subunit
VEQAFSRMKSEEAKLQSSQSTLARTQVRASIDGIVASRTVEPGEVAADGKALLTIIDLKDLEAEIMVSRKDILSLNKDTPVEVLSDGQKTTCSIKRISPEAAPGSGLYPVVVCLNGLDVLPGTHVEARFLVDKKKDLIIIPSEIVQRRGDKAYVYVVDSERAKLREIVPGEGQNGSVSIENGLSEGDLVVVRGHNLLFENALVALTGEAAAGTAGK